MKVTISVDDSHKLDLKIAEILNNHTVKGLFYVNSGLVGDKPRRNHNRFGQYMNIEELISVAKTHDIGGHSLSHHQCIRDLEPDIQLREIAFDRGILKKLTGQSVTSFCYPRGRYSNVTIDILKRIGYLDARTTTIGFGCIDDNPYRQRCFHLTQRSEYKFVHWTEYCIKRLKEAKKEDKDIRFFCHGWELEEKKDWDNFKNFIKWV